MRHSAETDDSNSKPSALVVDHVAVQFGGLQAVRDVSFQVSTGEIFGIVGPNGAGKSTLFNVITGVISPTSGKIIAFGDEIQKKPEFYRAQCNIGRTFQTIRNFKTQTVEEAVLTSLGAQRRGLRGWFGRPKENEWAELDAILRAVNMAEHRHKVPTTLTNLEQQRLAIGVALATGARILLLDEPSGGLIESEVAELLQLVRSLRGPNRAILIIDHKMRLMMNLCDRILVMTAGARLALGIPREVALNPRVREAYLGMKA